MRGDNPRKRQAIPDASVAGEPGWQAAFVRALREQQSCFWIYVPDNPLAPLLALARQDPAFTVVGVTREEEGIGVATGAFLGGARPVVLMQASGFGNTINALASLVIPQFIPMLLVITQRGALGEFNYCQNAMGRAVPAILGALGIGHHLIDDPARAAQVVGGAARTAFLTRLPVAVELSQDLPRISP